MPDGATSSGVTIIGGGLIGLCAALILRHVCNDITVIEATDIRKPVPGGLNARSIALSTSSVQIFRALGIWPQLSEHATPITNIHVSAEGRWGVTRMRASDYSLEALGYVIDYGSLTRCLLQAADECASITLELNAEFNAVRQAQNVEIDYRRDDEIMTHQTRFALVADGAYSSVRDALQIDHQTIDYAQSAVICNLQMSEPKAGLAYERFTTQGPLAMLPLSSNHYACIWTLSPEKAEQISALADDDFRASLQDCFGYRLGMIDAVGNRHSFPLRRTRAQGLHRGRCLMMGNAANALHPVAGQGFNLALRDMAGLYELLADQRLDQLSDEEIETMAKAYEDQRLAEQAKVIRYGDGLVTLFSNELPLLEHFRAAGLSMLDLIPALKTQVALSGMGMTFGGNRLLRGRL